MEIYLNPFFSYTVFVFSDPDGEGKLEMKDFKLQ